MNIPPRMHLRRWLAALLVSLVGACGGGGGTADPDGGVDAAPCVPGTPFDLTGTFGVLTTLREHIDVFGLQLEDPNPQAEAILRVDQVQNGTEVEMHSLMCDVTFPPIQLADQPKPMTFTLSHATLMALAAVPGSAAVSGETTCSSYDTTIPISVILGWRPNDPINDSLPTDEATQGCDGDSTTPCDQTTATGCICDEEHDGFPGASLAVANDPLFGDLDYVYATVRVLVNLHGKVYSPDLYTGAVDHALEQYILDCHRTSGPCAAGPAQLVRNINPTIEQDPDVASTFVAKRIDPSWDCDRLLAERPNLFPR